MNSLEEKLKVVAKSFFDDGIGDDDYPHNTVEEQYQEMLEDLKNGDLSAEFIEHVYIMNTHSS